MTPAAIAKQRGFEAMDTSALESLVDEAIAANAGAWEKFRGGEDKALGALVGSVMKASRGQADGAAVTAAAAGSRRPLNSCKRTVAAATKLLSLRRRHHGGWRRGFGLLRPTTRWC